MYVRAFDTIIVSIRAFDPHGTCTRSLRPSAQLCWQLRQPCWQIRQTFARLHQGNSADLPKRNNVLANQPAQMTQARDSRKPSGQWCGDSKESSDGEGSKATTATSSDGRIACVEKKRRPPLNFGKGRPPCAILFQIEKCVLAPPGANTRTSRCSTQKCILVKKPEFQRSKN